MTALRQEDIRGPDIAMRDAFVVCGVESIGNLDSQVQDGAQFDMAPFSAWSSDSPSSISIAM